MSPSLPTVVQSPDAPQRLDSACAAVLGIARSKVAQLIKLGNIRVNGRTAKAALIVYPHDQIEMDPTADRPATSGLECPLGILPTILFEDATLLVINKPVGVVVHPGHPAVNAHYLTDWLVSHDPKIGEVGVSGRPGIVHRLDQYTEGVMVIAKTNPAFDHLKQQFKDRTVEKAYYAMVRGNVVSDELTIDQPIGRHARKRRLMGVVPDGKPAQSSVQVIERFQTKTLVRVIPKTGRTHQIRVHLAFVQHPVMGDPLYGPLGTDRSGQRLQSYFLAFSHPLTGERLQFELPISLRIVG